MSTNIIKKAIFLIFSDFLKVSKGVLWLLFILNIISDIELHPNFPLKGFELLIAAVIVQLFETVFKLVQLKEKK